MATLAEKEIDWIIQPDLIVKKPKTKIDNETTQLAKLSEKQINWIIQPDPSWKLKERNEVAKAPTYPNKRRNDSTPVSWERSRSPLTQHPTTITKTNRHRSTTKKPQQLQCTTNRNEYPNSRKRPKFDRSDSARANSDKPPTPDARQQTMAPSFAAYKTRSSILIRRDLGKFSNGAIADIT